MKTINRLILTAIISFCICSCKDDYTLCNLSKNVNFTVGFYSHGDVPQNAPKLFVSQVGGAGYIYAGNFNVPSFTLPLNPVTDSAEYLVTLSGSALTDTITVVYGTENVQLSPDCGNIFINDITKFYSTSHTIDSVKIINPAVNTSAVQNARIYF